MGSLAHSAAVGVGFYGNSETNDGVHQLIYSLDNANHTFSGIDDLVRFTGSWPGPARPVRSVWSGPSQLGSKGAGLPLGLQLILPGANRRFLLPGRERWQE